MCFVGILIEHFDSFPFKNIYMVICAGKKSCFSSLKSWYITAYFHQTTCKKYASSHFTQQSLLLRSAHLTSKEAKPFLKSLSSTALLFSDFVTRRARLSLPFRTHAVFFVSRSKRKATKDLLSSMLLTAFHLLKDNAKKGGDGGAVKRLKTPKLTAQQYHNFSLLFALIALLSFVLNQSARIHSFHGYADQRIHIQIRLLDRIQRQKQYKPPRFLGFFRCWLLWHVHFIFL